MTRSPAAVTAPWAKVVAQTSPTDQADGARERRRALRFEVGEKACDLSHVFPEGHPRDVLRALVRAL